MRATVRAAVGTAIFTAVLFAMVGGAFYAGYVTARVGAPVPLVGALPLPPGLSPAPSQGGGERRDRLGVVDEVWRIVSDEYYDPSKVDRQRLSYAAIRGILDALG